MDVNVGSRKVGQTSNERQSRVQHEAKQTDAAAVRVREEGGVYNTDNGSRVVWGKAGRTSKLPLTISSIWSWIPTQVQQANLF